MPVYQAITNADVWANKDGERHVGQLQNGERVTIGWFWDTGYGQMSDGRYAGRYVNQRDMRKIDTEPTDPDPPVEPESEYMKQYKDGELVREWVPKNG